MKVDELLERAREAVDINQVFGVPVERGGVTIIPVARVMGGGGHGPLATDAGGGYGFRAEAAGVFVIRDSKVEWQPAVNVNKIVANVMAVGALGVISAPRIMKQVHKIVRDSR